MIGFIILAALIFWWAICKGGGTGDQGKGRDCRRAGADRHAIQRAGLYRPDRARDPHVSGRRGRVPHGGHQYAVGQRKGERELAILEMLYSTGCRVSELTGIKLSDIDWNCHSVSLLGKGKKYRTSYLNAKAEIAIRSYLSHRSHTSAYLFCNDRGGGKMKKTNIERMIRIIRNRAGMGDRRITSHTFRHTTATQALQSGMPITDIQVLLGHASVNTTMIYAHTSREAVQAGHKRCIV